MAVFCEEKVRRRAVCPEDKEERSHNADIQRIV